MWYLAYVHHYGSRFLSFLRQYPYSEFANSNYRAATEWVGAPYEKLRRCHNSGISSLMRRVFLVLRVSTNMMDDFVLRNLLTLLKIASFRLGEYVFKRILNVKKLHIRYDDYLRERKVRSNCCFYNRGRLYRLESL